MNETGDREGPSSVSGQGIPSQENEDVFSAHSISQIDESDLAILSVTGDGALTLLQISARIGMSFVECLRRVKRLEALGLLEQVPHLLSLEGLYYYSRTRPDDVERRRER